MCSNYCLIWIICFLHLTFNRHLTNVFNNRMNKYDMLYNMKFELDIYFYMFILMNGFKHAYRLITCNIY